MKRLEPNDRREQLLSAAVYIAKRDGYNNVTRDAIAGFAGVAPSLISAYFGTMTKLKRQIMRKAIRDEVVEIVAQGLIARDGQAKKAPKELQRKAMEHYVL